MTAAAELGGGKRREVVAEEREALRGIRRTRGWLLILIAAYLPLLLLATRMPRPRLACVVLSIIWAIAIGRAVARIVFSHCVRCGKYFHSARDAPSFRHLFVRSCMHCGLALRTDQVIYPSTE